MLALLRLPGRLESCRFLAYQEYLLMWKEKGNGPTSNGKQKGESIRNVSLMRQYERGMFNGKKNSVEGRILLMYFTHV